jgi:hypothetical protein
MTSSSSSSSGENRDLESDSWNSLNCTLASERTPTLLLEFDASLLSALLMNDGIFTTGPAAAESAFWLLLLLDNGSPGVVACGCCWVAAPGWWEDDANCGEALAGTSLLDVSLACFDKGTLAPPVVEGLIMLLLVSADIGLLDTTAAEDEDLLGSCDAAEDNGLWDTTAAEDED